MIDVSVVTGTYNRLPYLKKMVQSVRESVGPLKYEIILVDGGSVDGSQAWCRKQKDIVLIEQRELLGAVKAFNAGAFAARGDYVILANDDVEFIGLSILRAFSYVQDDDRIGVGCFYQDRGQQDWHVEQMPAVSMGGLQTSIPYGQVCIVPRWLGDHVGWWGNYLHTYGGDNELSCNVVELGYATMPIECACIHDMRVEDELRDINGGDPRTRGSTVHPDSKKWTRKWSSRGKVGPTIAMSRKVYPDISIKRQKRIFYAPIYEPGHKLQRQTKVGLRKALEKVGLVHECDYIDMDIEDILYEACGMCPDLFVLQIQDASTFNEDIIDEMKVNHPNAKFVSWNGDYHPKNLYDPDYIAMMKHFDVAGHAVASIKDLYQSSGIRWFYWQIGYEESDAEPNQTTPAHDVVFLGNSYSEDRKELGRFLIGLRDSGLDVGLYGNWPEGWSLGSSLYDFDEGQRIYRAARLAISDQQWPTATGYVSNRLFQAMYAGGCLVLQQYFDGMEEYLGLAEDTHLATWKNYHELGEEIKHYLHDDQMREWIAQAGHEYMLENHSFDKRVEELLYVLNW